MDYEDIIDIGSVLRHPADALPNRKLSHPMLGQILATLSAVLYAVLNLSVELLMRDTPWQKLMFIRMAITWCSTMDPPLFVCAAHQPLSLSFAYASDLLRCTWAWC